MSISRTIRRTVAMAALGAALFAGHAQANDQAHFTDVLKPHGYQRGLSEATADGQGCGASGVEINAPLPVFRRCMRRKGWVLDHYQRDPSQHARVQPQQNRWPGEVDWQDNWAAHQSQEQDDYFRSVDEANRANAFLGQ
jgi:hypothetical protein